MNKSRVNRRLVLLLLGDGMTLGVITLVGLARHQTLGTAGFRVLTTFLPLLAAWLLIAPHLGVYAQGHITDYRQLWRPFWAMVLAAPMAAWMRSIWLGAPIVPIFVVVLGGFSALGMLAWRVVYFFSLAMRRKNG